MIKLIEKLTVYHDYELIELELTIKMDDVGVYNCLLIPRSWLNWN